MTHLIVSEDVVTPEFRDHSGNRHDLEPFLVPESRTRVTWVFTDVDEVLAAMRRHPSARTLDQLRRDQAAGMADDGRFDADR